MDERVFSVVQGHARDRDPPWGHAAEHGPVTFPQHLLEGEHLGLVCGLSSCRSQSSSQALEKRAHKRPKTLLLSFFKIFFLQLHQLTRVVFPVTPGTRDSLIVEVSHPD